MADHSPYSPEEVCSTLQCLGTPLSFKLTDDIQYNAYRHSRRPEGPGPENAEIYLHPFDSS